jgi:hypothetical protein
MPIVYLTTNLINDKKYIGVDSKNNPAYLGSGKYLRKAIEKYGKENFTKEILFETPSLKEAYLKEKEIIQFLNADKLSEYYNVHEGGKGGWENIKTEGENNGMYGKSVLSVWIEKYGEEEGRMRYSESRKKAGTSISASLKGQTKSEEHRKNLSNSKKEYFKNETPEQREARIESTRKAMQNANIVRSDEYKRKMSESIKKVAHIINAKHKCKYCGIETNKGNLNRWHNDNCKQRNNAININASN